VSDEYVTFRLPKELVIEIDKIVNNVVFGYRSRAEFVAEAVREKILKIYELMEKYGIATKESNKVIRDRKRGRPAKKESKE